MNIRVRPAKAEDAALLAPLNAALIRDEGHRNPMSVAELELRMAGWLKADYCAVVAEIGGEAVGYALFRYDPDHVYLRQLFVAETFRREGIGRAMLNWLETSTWNSARRVRLEVLSQNVRAQSFWRAVGFKDYAVVMEKELADVQPALPADAPASGASPLRPSRG